MLEGAPQNPVRLSTLVAMAAVDLSSARLPIGNHAHCFAVEQVHVSC